MKRLFQLLRSLLAIISLLLFIATSALYFRGQTHLDEFHIYRPRFCSRISSAESRISIQFWFCPAGYSEESWSGLGEYELSRVDLRLISHLKYGYFRFSHQIGPFAYGRLTAINPVVDMTATGRIIMFPHWLLLLLFALPPALALRRFIRQRLRAAHGLCPTCGYDLRATPALCPECGQQPRSTQQTGQNSL